jgi:hypothetical protein
MRSSARDRANRANARSSTGPKTVAGKLRVAQNAYRHGLAIPAGRDPNLSRDIEGLAVVVAGERPGAARLEAARRIAEAQIDLLRVQRARYELLAGLARQQVGRSKKGTSSIVRDINSPRSRALTKPCEAGVHHGGASSAQDRGPPPRERVQAIIAGLAVLDRYERRTLSRLKAAVRTFDIIVPDSIS